MIGRAPGQAGEVATRKALAALAVLGAVLSASALLVLGARAVLRLDTWWDAPAYHLPFAALRGGLAIPYDMSDRVSAFYQGFPPLADAFQGFLWWLTGSVNAVGVINWLGFVSFLAYCRFCLGAPVWLVALVSLCAPLVIIHLAVCYVDLFANSLLAIGVAGCLGALLLGERFPRWGLPVALAGLAGAAWSKVMLVPLVAVFLLVAGVLCLTLPATGRRVRLRNLGLVLLAAVIAALPYVKNLEQYGNPFWPAKVPGFGDRFPFTYDSDANASAQRPATLSAATQPELFVRSLFEIGHPRRYPHRSRWTIDQGNAWVAYRSGGFWWLGAVFFIVSAAGLLVTEHRRRGAIAAAGFLGVLVLLSMLPQSHELRYYLFLPLTWAAVIGLCFPAFSRRRPRSALLFLVVTTAFFAYMVAENRGHYRVERVGWREAARQWGVERHWAAMQPGRIYCAVDLLPAGLFLTGPTARDFTVVDRSREDLCPEGSQVITREGIRARVSDSGLAQSQALLNQSYGLVGAGKFAEAMTAAREALALRPDFAEAWNNICVSLMGLGQPEQALEACRKALELKPDFSLAGNNLRWAESRVKEMGASRKPQVPRMATGDLPAKY